MQPDLLDLHVLHQFRTRSPLTHCMTNDVVQTFTANVLLALGASPAMVIEAEEAEQFAGIADALLINVGTLTSPRAQSMRRAIESAVAAGKPWALDPVAVGALGLAGDEQADRDPRLDQSADVQRAGQPHEQPAGHVGRTGREGGDERAEPASGQHVIVEVPGAAVRDEPDRDHRREIDEHGDELPGLVSHEDLRVEVGFSPVMVSTTAQAWMAV